MSERKDVQITVRIPERMKVELEEAAEADGRKMAGLVTHVLRQWLDARAAPPIKPGGEG